MDRLTSNLLLYRDLGEDSILLRLAGIFRDYRMGNGEREALVSRIYAEVKRLLALGATRTEWRYEPYADYVVLLDPDGIPFCVVQK